MRVILHLWDVWVWNLLANGLPQVSDLSVIRPSWVDKLIHIESGHCTRGFSNRICVVIHICWLYYNYGNYVLLTRGSFYNWSSVCTTVLILKAVVMVLNCSDATSDGSCRPLIRFVCMKWLFYGVSLFHTTRSFRSTIADSAILLSWVHCKSLNLSVFYLRLQISYGQGAKAI